MRVSKTRCRREEEEEEEEEKEEKEEEKEGCHALAAPPPYSHNYTLSIVRRYTHLHANALA